MSRALVNGLLGTALVASTFTAVMCVCHRPASGDPDVITPGGVEYNCGIVPEGQLVSHVFTIRNDGTGPLKIGRMIKNCACIDARIGKRELLPGESTEVACGYVATKGAMRAVLAIETNDKSRRWINLSICGIVQRTVQCYPGAFTFWGSEVSPQVVQLVVARPVSGWQVRCSKGWINAKVVAQKGGNTCVVSLSRECPGGTWGESVTLTAVCGAKEETIIIPVLLRDFHPIDGERSANTGGAGE